MASQKTKNKTSFQLFKSKKKKQSEDDIIQELLGAYNNIDTGNINKLEDFPLSEKTKRGLSKYNFINPTEIQRISIARSLLGEDVLGAAKTGSGKTLAFLIPLLEVLYRNKWTKYDKVGALVITPTRELAYQIFETLKKIGEFHNFSAGLIIGGKDLKFERKRMDQCNIIICTPGRLLQHMDENPLFDCCSLQILILDEADRCLDMGFEKTMNSIIENLPVKRQTLLFSATQTKSVKNLARLSLTNPTYIAVDEKAKYSTPSGLVQSYIRCDLSDKINFLWSFIKNHGHHKSLIFLSSCKQVKYVHEIFCKLKPGISLLSLYGSLHQMKRMTVYNSFCRKQHVVLFATDIAARGLDFPNVNWVVQLDCPESAIEYIHRAGRTARYQCVGESLLVLMPSEIKILELLEKQKIPIQEIQVNMKKLQNIQRNMEALLARDANLKESAQRAFVAYIKSVFLMKDKEIFDVRQLNTDAFARSLGLIVSPRIRFLQKYHKVVEQQISNDTGKRVDPKLIEKINQTDDYKEVTCSLNDENNVKKKDLPPKIDLQKRTFNFYDDSQENNDFLYIKRKDHELDIEPVRYMNGVVHSKLKKPCTRTALIKKMLKKKILPNRKIVFSEDGQVIRNKNEYASDLAREYEEADDAGIDIATAQMVLREEDKYDKQLFREKVKQKHRERKRKLKESNEDENTWEAASSESDAQPDLSPLSGLDECSGRADASKGSTSDEAEIERSVEYNLHIPARTSKQELKSESGSISGKRRKRINGYENVDLNTLAVQEELVLQLMSACQ